MVAYCWLCAVGCVLLVLCCWLCIVGCVLAVCCWLFVVVGVCCLLNVFPMLVSLFCVIGCQLVCYVCWLLAVMRYSMVVVGVHGYCLCCVVCNVL